MLYGRIEQRVDGMLQAGLMKEVAGLLAGGLGPHHTAMQAIGYKEMVRALRGEITQEEAVTKVKQESRRYAKRQLSWLNRDESIRWIFWEREPNAELALQKTLKEYDAALG